MNVEMKAAQQGQSQGLPAAPTPPAPPRSLAEQIRQDVQQSMRSATMERDLARMQADLQRAQAQLDAASAQMQAAQAGAAVAGGTGRGGVPLPPPPRTIQVGRDGRVVVSSDGGAFVQGGPVTTTSQGVPDVPPRAATMAKDISLMFFVMIAVIAIGVPLVRAFARWLDRRGTAPAGLPADIGGRLDRIEQAVEAVAIEVERISEGQRFTSKLLADFRQAPQLPVRDAQQVPR